MALGDAKHPHFSKGITPTGGLPSTFTKTRKQTFQSTLARLPDAFWKLCEQKFAPHQIWLAKIVRQLWTFIDN